MRTKTYENTPLRIISLNSLTYFLLAYYTVIILTNSFSILLANLSGFGGTLYYYGFVVTMDNKAWTRDLSFLIFFIGIGFSFFLGLIFERIYKKMRRHTRPGKLYFLWGYLISFSYFFGNIIVGSFFYFGTGVVFENFSIPMIIRILIAVMAFFILVIIGYYSVRNILVSYNTYFVTVRQQFFTKLLHAQLLFPFIIGNLIIFLLKIPKQAAFKFLDTLVLMTIAIPIISIYMNVSKQPSLRFKRKYDKIIFNKFLFYTMVIMLIVLRTGLSFGIIF